ncbi:MAG: CopD family protein, partial [Deltaproteobacteria bacterium]
MEHAALHGIQIVGLLLALAAPLLLLGLLRPAWAGAPASRDFAERMARSVATWAWRGAAAAALASAVGLVVSVAEIEGNSAVAGADPALVARFAAGTTVGRLAVARGALLLAAALVARGIARSDDPLDRTGAWLTLAACAASAVVATALVSHAAASPSGRDRAVLGQVLHLVAAALWMATVLHLVLARAVVATAERDAASIALVAGLVRRFSPLALASAATLALSGTRAAWLALGSTAAVSDSAYGLTLLVKLALLALVLVAAGVNAWAVRPDLERAASDPGLRAGVLQRFGRMLELEATAGLFVILVAGILGSVSPPGGNGAGRLLPAQVRAVTHPRLPQTDVVDPATWVGRDTRSDDDL